MMVGLGEEDNEVAGLLRDLHACGCDLVTIGQYLAPSITPRHLPAARYVTPEGFDNYRRMALELGFRHVKSGPLVRSSYLAEQGFAEAQRIPA
jgi:lipoic acid synthetase